MSGISGNNDFQDPLEDYSPPTFDDPIEKKLHEDRAAAIQSAPFTAVPANMLVADVLKQMIGEDIACVLVEEDGKLVGVFSDRDVLNKVALDFESASTRPVRDLMTPEPVFVRDTDPAAAMLTVVAVSGHRHVPILDGNDKILGIASPRRIADYLTACFG
ncbi:MAG: CBS domain-containing protein [Planctomycetaceae bacterium]